MEETPRTVQEIGQPPAMHSRAVRISALAAGSCCFLLAVLQLCGAIAECDVFWHLSYGKRILATGSLVVDPAGFAWGPLDAPRIVCSWIFDLLALTFFEQAGVFGLVLLRGAALVLFFWISVRGIRRMRLEAEPLAWLALFCGIELFRSSVVAEPSCLAAALFLMVVTVWRRLKSHPQEGNWRVYLIPLAFLLWSNCDLSVRAGLVLLVAIWLGEHLNALAGSAKRLGDRTLTALNGAVIISLITPALTPYGPSFALSVYAPFAKWELLEGAGPFQFPPIYLAGFASWIHWSTILILAILWLSRKGGLDWASILGTIMAILASAAHARLGYLFAVMLTVIAVDHLPAAKSELARLSPLLYMQLSIAIAVVSLLVLGSNLFDRTVAPAFPDDPAFRIGDVNPVFEAEFIERHLAGKRIGTDWNGGSYLGWKLSWPAAVFADSRNMVATSELGLIEEFLSGTSRALLDRHAADAWYLPFSWSGAIRVLYNDPQWRPAYLGSAGTVFVRSDGAKSKPAYAPEALAQLRNPHWIEQIVEVAMTLEDWNLALELVERLEMLPEVQTDPVNPARLRGLIERARQLAEETDDDNRTASSDAPPPEPQGDQDAPSAAPPAQP